MSPHERANRIIDTALAAVVGEANWQDIPDAINATAPGARTTFFVHDANHGRGNFAITSGFSSAETRSYDEYFSKINPWMPAASRRAVGAGVIADQMLPRQELIRTEFHADFLAPMGCESAAGVTIEKSNGRLSLLSILLPQADAESNLPCARVLSLIAPPLRRIMLLQKQAAFDASMMGATGDALQTMNLGTVIVGDNRSIRLATPAAHALAEEGRGFDFAPDARFRLQPGPAAEALNALLAWEPGPQRSYCDVLIQGRLATRLVMVRIASDIQTLYIQGPCVVIIIQALTHARMDFDIDLQTLFALKRIFQLTDGEAEVLRLLASGLGAAEIARVRSVSRETVKSQLASLFRKTGMRSQNELIRLVLRR